MKYEVMVSETSYGCVTVEADNEDDARELAYDLIVEGQVCWGKIHCDTGTVKEL